MKFIGGGKGWIIFAVPIILVALGGYFYFSHKTKPEKITPPKPTVESVEFSSETKEVSGWRTFKDPNGRFSFNYPAKISTLTFEQLSNDSREPVVRYIGKTGQESLVLLGPYPDSVNSELGKYWDHNNSYINYPHLDQYKPGVKSYSEGGGIEEELNYYKINGKETILLTTRMSDDQPPVNYFLAFKTDLGIYTLDLGLEQNMGDSVLKSFKFFNTPLVQTPAQGWVWTPDTDCKINIPTPIDSKWYTGFINREKYRLDIELGDSSKAADAMIEFKCIHNTNGNTLDQFTEMFQPAKSTEYWVGNGSISSLDTIISKEKIQKWGQNVSLVKFKDGNDRENKFNYTKEVYLTVDSNFMYIIGYVDWKENSEVTDLANSVLEKMTFEK